MNTNNDPNDSQGGTASLDARAQAALAAYLEPGFDRPTGPLRFPFPDDPCVATWHGYRVLAIGGPVWPVLQQRLPQLRFAAGPDVSDSAAYRAATRRGALAEAPALGAPDGLHLSHPDLLRLSIHRTSAGRIPVLEPHGRADFEALLRAFLHKSTPIPIAQSMGAVMIAGYNNWDRIHVLREAWLAEGNDPDAWQAYFKAFVVPDKPSYQDRFIILSDGGYSSQTGSGMTEHEEAAKAAAA
jgi:hypothetical protein